MSSPIKKFPRISPADVEAAMRIAYTVGVAELRAVENDHGASLRGMLGSVLPLLRLLGVTLIESADGDIVGCEFTRDTTDGPRHVAVRYDEQGCAAMRDETVLLHASGKGAGENARTAPEELFVRHIRTGLLNNEHLLIEAGLLPKDKEHPAYKKWRNRYSLAAANRIAKAAVNEFKHQAIDKHPARLGAYTTVLRQRPILRGTGAAVCLSGAEDAERMAQTIAQRAWSLLMPGKLPAISKMRKKAALAMLGLEGSDDRLTEDGVAAIAFVLSVRGRDLDPRKLRKLLPAGVAEALPLAGWKQRLILMAIARVWLTTEAEESVRALGLWLCREVGAAKSAADISKGDLASIIDFAGVPIGRIEELRALYLGDNERLGELRAFDVEMSLADALAACDAVRDAAEEERRLLAARVLQARVEAERLALQARIARFDEPFGVNPPFLSGTARLRRSRLRLVHLPTEAALVDAGVLMRNCLGSKAGHARAGRLQFYQVVRRLTKVEREKPRVELDGHKLPIIEHPELGPCCVLASVSLAAMSKDELRVVELRGRGNSAPPAAVVSALRAHFPRH